MPELSLIEAAGKIGRDPSTIAKLAVEAATDAAAQRALREKRLPGRRIGRFWLFRPEHVAAFAKIPRPVGRPPADS